MITHELPWRTPIEVATLLRDRDGFAFLDSGGDDLVTGRYSFIGYEPFGTFVIRNGKAFWNDAPLDGAPLDHLREALSRWSFEPAPDAPPFRGGCIGHISYDFGRQLEKLRAPVEHAPTCSDLNLSFYDVILAFDRLEQRFFIYSSGFPEQSTQAHAEARLQQTLALLDATTPETATTTPIAPADWHSNFTPQGFRDAVEAVRGHILNGDIYQANLTQRFEAPLPDGFDAWALYQNLRGKNPAPFGGFLTDGGTLFASSSPERFLSLRGRAVEARPIKGTIKRGQTPKEDQARAAQLLASEKDHAENTMIVDLLRNDMSRVCRPNSVEVPVLCGLETYASVHHLTSVVRGELENGRSAVDLIECCFPGGSITGAPKIRAMDIITEQEQIARGVYCGCIGYIGFDGAMDLNIAIRTAVLGEGRAVVQAGGGITLLSDPQSEYEESLIKAERLFAAFATQPEEHSA